MGEIGLRMIRLPALASPLLTVHDLSTEGKELAFLPRGARRRGAGAQGREKAACAISRMSEVKNPPNVHVLNVASYVAM